MSRRESTVELVRRLANSAATQRSRGPVAVNDFRGYTDEDRLKRALDASRPGDVIIGDSRLEINLTSELNPVKANVGIDMLNALIRADTAMAAVFEGEPNTDGHRYRNMRIDCNDNVSGAAIRQEGGYGFEVSHSEIYHSPSRYIDAFSDRDNFNPIGGVLIDNVYLHTPRMGVGHPIMIRSVAGGPLVQGATVRNCKLWGCDPFNPNNADYTAGNEFTADYVIAQGVENLLITDNFVRFSGSAGYSVSRMTRNAHIQGNYAIDCFEPGFNTGSGNIGFHVDDITGFVEFASATGYDSALQGVTTTSGTGQDLTGVNTNSNRVINILPDESGTGGWIILEQAGGGNPDIGHTVNQLGTAVNTTISMAPADALYAPGQAGVLHGANDLALIGNYSFDTYRTGVNNVAAFNCIRTRGLCEFYGNYAENPHGQGAWDVLFRGANSTFAVGDNHVNGELAKAEDYIVTGPGGLLTSTAFPSGFAQPTAQAQISAAGAFVGSSFNNNMASVTNTGAGGYDYVFTNPMADDDYVVNLEFANANITATITAKTVNGFSSSIRVSGTATNRGHFVQVSGRLA